MLQILKRFYYLTVGNDNNAGFQSVASLYALGSNDYVCRECVDILPL